MNQSQLIEAVAEKLAAAGIELTKRVTAEVVQAVFDAIKEGLVAGNDVTLPQLGKLKVKEVPARTGRNPKTGETLTIAAKKKAAFTASSTLKADLN